MKKWSVGTPKYAQAKELSAKGGITMLAAHTLVALGIDTMEKAIDFFGQESDDSFGFSDPFLIKDMDKACDIITDAVEKGLRICVYGDYDCDGITSTAVMYSYLSNIGGNVEYYINDRSEGYGMNCEAVERLHQRGVEVIITVDNGISAFEEAKLCKKLGITLVITDHHQPSQELPLAAAIVDAHRTDSYSPYRYYCGCGLALKFIAAMEGGDMSLAIEQYSDLAAIATIADIVALTGENRQIVRHGLHYLEVTENAGLIALMEQCSIKKPISSQTVAFTIAPRINASGRIAKATEALELLLCEDIDEARILAGNICEYNTQRKSYENVIMEDIENMIENNPSLLDKRVLVFSGENWHHGVIGIVAARCQERFDRPAFLMVEEDGFATGSARASQGFSVFEALSHCGDILEKYGGHSGAGGFTVKAENIKMFDDKLQEFAQKLASEKISFTPVLNAVKVIGASELIPSEIRGLDILEPFGECNPRPLFAVSGAVIVDIIPLKEGLYTKLVVDIEGKRFNALMFSCKTEDFPFSREAVINMIVSLEVNEFRGTESVVLRVVDIMKAGVNRISSIAAEDVYHSFRRGEEVDKRLVAKMIPTREELVVAYKSIAQTPIAIENVFARILATHSNMNYCKVLLCMDIFDEAGLIIYNRFNMSVRTSPISKKADLTATATYKRLEEMQQNG